MNDTEAGWSKFWEKFIFNLEFYIETIKCVWVYKNIFMQNLREFTSNVFFSGSYWRMCYTKISN